MTETNHRAPTAVPAGLRWQKSTFSPADNCVEVAGLPDGTVAVRNSNDVDAGALVFTQAEMAAWVKGCKAGEFDRFLA